MTKESLAKLKERANELGVEFRDNISEAKLKERVERAEKELESPPAPDVPEVEIVQETKTEKTAKAEKKQMTEEEYVQSKEFRDQQKEATRLIRCQITSMDPMDKDVSGQIFDLGNQYTGKVSKYIPFGETWHVPKMILDFMRDATFLSTRMIKGEGNTEILEQRYLPKYAINVLPDLTMEERKKLAQISSQGLG